MSFVQELVSISMQNRAAWQTQENERISVRNQRIQTFFDNLSEKHLTILLTKLTRAANQGKREAFINFPRDDFRMNIPGTGDTRYACNTWLETLSAEGGQLDGIRFDVWGNAKFTTKFSW